MPPWDKGNRTFHSSFWAKHGLIGPCLSVHLAQVQPLCNFPSIWPQYSRYHFVSFRFSKLVWSIFSKLLLKSLYPRHSNIHCQLPHFHQMAPSSHWLSGLFKHTGWMLFQEIRSLEYLWTFYIWSHTKLYPHWTDFHGQGHMTSIKDSSISASFNSLALNAKTTELFNHSVERTTQNKQQPVNNSK